jgi:hypothetical protein
MKRSALVTALTLALLVLLSGAALATGKPVRVFIGGPLDVPVGSCSFPVTQHILTNNEYILIFTGDHPAIVTGSLTAHVTNDLTGNGIDLNISGPAFITANTDGSTTVKLAGRSTIFLPDRPGFWLTSGAATVVVGPTGNTVSVLLPNSAQDLCPVLATL